MQSAFPFNICYIVTQILRKYDGSCGTQDSFRELFEVLSLMFQWSRAGYVFLKGKDDISI